MKTFRESRGCLLGIGLALAAVSSMSADWASEPEPIQLQLQQGSAFLSHPASPVFNPTPTLPTSSMGSDFATPSIASPTPASGFHLYQIDTSLPANREPIRIINVSNGSLLRSVNSVGNTLYTPPSAMPSP